MSDKRFVQVGDTSIKDTLTGEKYYAPCEDGLLDLLNEQQDIITELNKQIEQLNLAIDDLLSHTSCDEIKKENEQLRKQVKSSETTSDATSNYNAHLESKITTLEKENEQLKKKLESLQKVLHLVECVSDE